MPREAATDATLEDAEALEEDIDLAHSSSLRSSSDFRSPVVVVRYCYSQKIDKTIELVDLLDQMQNGTIGRCRGGLQHGIGQWRRVPVGRLALFKPTVESGTCAEQRPTMNATTRTQGGSQRSYVFPSAAMTGSVNESYVNGHSRLPNIILAAAMFLQRASVRRQSTQNLGTVYAFLPQTMAAQLPPKPPSAAC